MNRWVNPGAEKWITARNEPYYVDKTEMLLCLNRMINMPYRYVAVTRPRRFGKTTDMDMIAAYYDNTVDGQKAFAGMKIPHASPDDKQRNQYHVISLDMLRRLGGGTPLNGIYNTTVQIPERVII